MMDTLILLQLGATSDEMGRPDVSAHIRAAHTLRLYREAVAAGLHCRVLTSGGSGPDPGNGSSMAVWWVTARMLVARGLPDSALITPGLHTYNTVEEALQARKALQALDATVELVLITSDYHAARAEHLFRIAFGRGAGLHIPLRVDAVPSMLPQAELDALLLGFEVAPEISVAGRQFSDLEARVAHEAKGLHALREAPFGPWLEFLQAHGLADYSEPADDAEG
jgi:hypothetical protein